MSHPPQPCQRPSDPNPVSANPSIRAGDRQPRTSPVRPSTAPRSSALTDARLTDASRGRPALWLGSRVRARLAVLGRAGLRIAVPAAIGVLILAVPSAGYAATGDAVLAANSLPQVITNLQTWLVGILAAIATLFAVLAGVYWATAGGDPAQVDRAKGALRNALVGYGAAVLAPVFLQIVRGIVGG